MLMQLRPDNDAPYPICANLGRNAQPLGLSHCHRSSPREQNGLLSRKGNVLHSPCRGKVTHKRAFRPALPHRLLLLSPPADQSPWLTCRVSGVRGEAGWDAAPSQGQEENQSPGPKETVLSNNKLLWPRHLSLLTETQPHLLPGAAEAALQNCLHHTDPLEAG